MKRFTKHRALAAGALLIAGAAALVYAKRSNDDKPAPLKYRASLVDTGSITHTVTATGTINPVALVNVGSQVSGTVVELKADFNDRVKKGQVLLKLDPTIFTAQVGQALDQSRRDLDMARANQQLANAQLERALADVNNSVIRSPIDGVIIKRTIDLGQTVAASFNTPNLFQIAQDLTKMQIDTSVSEADVGALKDGLPARFVVDAYPSREFNATMRQFRLAPNVVQNVVTYNVVLDVDNKDELLKPGMTAQVRLVVDNRPKALRIPTAALRFRPSEDEQEKERKALADKKAKEPADSASLPQLEDDLALRSAGETARARRHHAALHQEGDAGARHQYGLHFPGREPHRGPAHAQRRRALADGGRRHRHGPLAQPGRRGARPAGQLQARGRQRDLEQPGARRDAGHVQDP